MVPTTHHRSEATASSAVVQYQVISTSSKYRENMICTHSVVVVFLGSIQHFKNIEVEEDKFTQNNVPLSYIT